MRVLVIGGTGFIGSAAVAQLVRGGHEVTVFHRGKRPAPAGAREIIGHRRNLPDFTAQFRALAPCVVLDTIIAGERQALLLAREFRGFAPRVVMLSSGDVYRAAGILHRTEPGEPDNTPITEDSPLRRNLHPYPPEVLNKLREMAEWLDDDYDKIPAERVIMGQPDLPGTVLRLPMVYGPGDPLHRLFPYLKRMDDRRPAILLEEGAARWRGLRGYVEDVAAAIALAVTDDRTAGRVYNVAECEAYTEADWVRRIAGLAGWIGQIVRLPAGCLPEHLKNPVNYLQHWVMDSTRIRAELGYREIVATEEALRRTIAWERANPPASIDPAQFDYAAEDAALGKATASQG